MNWILIRVFEVREEDYEISPWQDGTRRQFVIRQLSTPSRDKGARQRVRVPYSSNSSWKDADESV